MQVTCLLLSSAPSLCFFRVSFGDVTVVTTRFAGKKLQYREFALHTMGYLEGVKTVPGWHEGAGHSPRVWLE